MSQRPAVDFSVPEAQPFLLEGGDHGVVLIHGFTGSAAHMRPLGERLNQQGFTVMGINLPGHAETMEAMGRADWKQWLQAAKEAVCTLKARCRFVSCAGLSMGGVLTLLIAEQTELTAAAPISAPMGVKNKALPFAKFAAPFMPTVMWHGDPVRASILDSRYDLGYPGFPTKCGADLWRLIKLARKNLFAVTCPLLVVQSHADETISEDSADVIMAGASSQKKGVLWLDDVPHVCTISPELPAIAESLGKLFKEAEQN